ncbi:LysR family transcriptional regulator [Streptomyces sp. NPDC048191]|uniref:LysR family transcriptional regulator n=1 Tax=Streptomyces sp. NPDC048191 TaxID=3155484 RepID=UPI00340F3128
MHLEFRHLRVLLTVAEAGSIRRAAARLQLSQPATSAQLKRTEHELGGPLFIRSADGVAPNERGQYVLRCARDLVVGFDRLREYARSAAEEDRQAAAPLRVGGTAGPLVPLLVSALFELVRRQRHHRPRAGRPRHHGARDDPRRHLGHRQPALQR